MSHQSDLIATDIDSYLKQHEKKELLRFLTCGSVDDGKSTLIGRLFYDAKMIYEDQLESIRKDSKVHGTTGSDFDPALLTDGLKAEREQGITIDVAYRYFSTAKRKFIIADTPGHEQYTRNMATGASTCDLAIILIDARHGVVEQTKRHAFITSLLGIRHVLVAVNKMDLVDWDEKVFDKIKSDYTDFAARLTADDVHFIPISALNGDNLIDASPNTPWYDGSTLMHMLENVHIASDRNLIDFRFPVQFVSRPNLDFRGFCGTVASGVVRPGDEVMALPSRKTSKIKSIVIGEMVDGKWICKELEQAFAPQSVTLTLEDEIDVSRGDMLVRTDNVPQSGSKLDMMVVWMDENPLVPGKQYLFKHTTNNPVHCPGSISQLRYKVDVNTLRSSQAPALGLNEIGRIQVSLNQPIHYDSYRRNAVTGAMIIIDKMTNGTVGAAMIVNRSTDEGDHWNETPTGTLQKRVSEVSAEEWATRFGQQPTTILLTGLTGAGKTTIANALQRRLFDQGRVATVIDGQSMRAGLSRDLDFSAKDRSENLRRCVEVAHLINQTGTICICAFVSPSREVRDRFRAGFDENQFLMAYLSAPLEVCRTRDKDGIYEAADRGEMKSVPGISQPYEVPEDADLILPTHEMSVDQCVDALVELLKSRKRLG